MGKVKKRSKDALIFQHLRTEKPNARQIEFFKSTALHTMYGGARGGGKSWAARRKSVLLCMEYAGLKGLLLRRTFTELRNNHIIPLTAELDGYAQWKDKEKAFLFPNGSRLQLGYCDNDNDKLQYQGAEYDFIIFEEATNFEEEWIVFISTALRTTRTDFKPRIYYTCNPGGVSHAYFKRLFIDRQFKEGENPEDYAYIPATVYDNAVLMQANPEYIKQLLALPEAKRRAHLDGDWNVFEGAFFAEFRSESKKYKDAFYTHVCEPFEIPETWYIYRSFDWGYSKPFSCSWWAIDFDGRAFKILELYGCATDANGNVLPDTGVKWTADRVFSEIARIEREHRWLKGKRIEGVADPAIWAENGGEPIISAADRHGVYFTKGDNTRLPGWMQVRYRLAFDEEGRPMVYIFSTCRHAIRTLPLLQYSETNPEDLNTKQEDHFADDMRYFCMLNPIPPRVQADAKRIPQNPLEDQRRYDRFSY